AAIAAMLSFKVSLSITLMVIVLCALGLIPISVVNIYIDLRKPKLEWNNAQEAIKQNANVIVGMLLGFLIMAVYGVIAYLITTLNLNVYAIFGIMAVVLLLLSDVSMHLLHKVAKKGYQHLEI
ncbi:MAG: hypothetical protein N2376_10230, partial [Clostridia bacterium]|nr:hypothetical protein [Clostridia bacterium]